MVVNLGRSSGGRLLGKDPGDNEEGKGYAGDRRDKSTFCLGRRLGCKTQLAHGISCVALEETGKEHTSKG